MDQSVSEWVAKRLPKRPKDAHKGTFGKVLAVAGSKNYPGAAYLTCAAAYRVGAGLVTLATDNSTKIIVSRKLPEVTFLSFGEVFEKIKGFNVLVLGPGLGQVVQVREFLKTFCTNYSNLSRVQSRGNRTKAIIDGDGLNILSKMGRWWESLSGEVVLTPHPGEMSRLTGLNVEQIQSDRENIAIKFAKDWNKIIVLKGANTIIASPSGEVAISPFANPALATAGTGDVLSGIIAGFLAQGLNPFDAACCGVYIHGLAGEEIAEKIGDAGSIASDLLPILPKILHLLM